MPKTKSIDLLPELEESEVKEIKKKGRLNLFGVFSIFIIVFASIVILLLNLFARIDYNRKNQRLADTENELRALQYIELKQKTLNTKLDTFESVQEHDFSSDVVLAYLLEVAGGLSDVQTMYLDDSMTFELSGTAKNYINVARLWHDMAQQEDYFEYVNLRQAMMAVDQDTGKKNRIRYAFDGKMVKENVDNL